jgi:hypothetical protein
MIDPDDRLFDLAGAVCNKTVSEGELSELNALLAADRTCRYRYADYCRIHAALRLELRARRATLDVHRQIQRELEVPSSHESDAAADVRSAPVPIPSIDPTVPAAFGYLSSGWPVAYLVATVIFAIGLLVGAMVHVSQPPHVVRDIAPQPSVFPADPAAVARITAMVDCVWEGSEGRVQGSGTSHQKLGIINQKSILRLGDRLALRSGLLQITYNTGAKVILQGPVTYEVESAAGGYLSIGKLTAKLEKKSEVRGQRSEPANEKFAVRTPTAIVTDLGTEFGIEVERDGLCRVQVFQGEVEAAPLRDGKPVGRSRRLVEGQSARIVGSRPIEERAVKIIDAANQADSKPFVRKMPVLPSNRVFSEWQTGPTGTFSAAKDDLINVDQPTLAKIELTSGEAGWKSSVRKLNDGTTYVDGEIKPLYTGDALNPKDGAVVTVMLNMTRHPLGYDIRSIVSLTGSGGAQHSQDRSSQKYDVAYSRVGEPDEFIPLRGQKSATVDRSAYGAEEEQVTLFGPQNRPMATGVAKLRFTFHNTQSPDPESVYREIDVFGSPTNGPTPVEKNDP